MESLFKPKEYFKAKRTSEVLTLLKTHGSRARLVAGNTTLNEMAKNGLLGNVEVLIDINDLPFGYIRENKNNTALGATITLSSAFDTFSRQNNSGYQCLVDALQCVRPVQVRNMATIGGCLCSGVPFLDFPIALVAMDAKVKVVFKDKRCTMPVIEFMKNYSYGLTLTKGLVTEVLVPKVNSSVYSSYTKFSRTKLGEAVVGVACRLSFELDSDRCSSAGIALAGSGIDVTRLSMLERNLEGKVIVDNILDDISNFLKDVVNPVSDHETSAAYKLHVASVLIKRTLLSISESRGVNN
ncbi:MAG: FAD binding domain-containing protein [Nitrososphaerota archaeon]|nr:FAD binding domain-containing protein [Nitrososphaerota archaeon]